MCQTNSPQYQDFTEHNKFVICIKHELGKHGFLELLCDTGATCSMIKIDHINQEAYLNPSDILEIGGAFGGQQTTFGSITTVLKFEHITKECKFHVIENTDSIPADGILGGSFLQDNIIMDCVDHIMYCCDNNTRSLVKISDNFGLNKTTLEDIAPWEKYNKGIGQKLLFDQGYRLGAGLGQSGQGTDLPVLITENNNYTQNQRYGVGFNTTYVLNEIDHYNQHCATLRSIETEQHHRPTKSNYFEFPETDYTIVLKPRTESIVDVRIKEKGKRFCPAVNFEDGIFTSNTIVKSINGHAKIAIINSTHTEVRINNFYPATEPIHFYQEKYLPPENNQNDNIQKIRFDKLKEIIYSGDWTNMEREAIESILHKYQDIFHLPGDKLSFTNVRKFNLPLMDNSKIINKKQYRLPEKHREEIQKQINKLLEDDIIEPSNSPFNSPVILVPKKGIDTEGNKLFRMCVDFRELNKVSVPYSFPLPRIEDILDALGGALFFSVLDLSQGFHQVLIHESDKEKTAFSSNFGHYQYKRCPFGLKTLPGFFQSLLNGILSGLQGVKCFVYIDDVVIFSPSLEEHIARITEVFDRFRNSNVKLNPQKCKFLQKEVTYLGHKCSTEGVRPDERLIEAIQKFPTPNTIRKLQSFIGLVNYYRQFIPNFARKAGPLYSLLQGVDSSNKKSITDWTPECEYAFQNLKEALVTEPILVYPDFSKDFTITCDASLEGLGAVLEQDKKVIAYASRTLLDTEKKWSATELELNAIVFSWKSFKPYVLGRHVKVFSDHMPLKGVLKMKDTASRIVRLQQKLIEFDYEVVYKKGKENGCADFLSRNPLPENSITLAINEQPKEYKTQYPSGTIEDYFSDTELQYYTVDSPATNSEEEVPAQCMVITRGQAARQAGQSKTPLTVQLPPARPRNQNQHNKTPELAVTPICSPNDESHSSTHESESDDDEWLEMEEFRNNRNSQITNITRPKDMETILKDYHDSVFGGHFGIAKTYDRIRRRFYWKGMKRYIAEYISNCQKCQRNKIGRATRMKLCETDLSHKPFDKIYIDLVGPLPETASGNKHILSMVDDLTRFVEFVAIPDQTANTVARALYENILCRYTLPKVIISDNGANFLSNLFKELGLLLKIDRRQTSPFSPQGNIVERQHSTLANYLRCFVENDTKNWDTYLRTAAHAYNNTTHISTSYSPMELLFGYTAEIPSNLKRKPTPLYNHDDYYHELRYKLQTSFNIAREKLSNAKSKSKEYYDRHTNQKTFKINQFVMMKNTDRKNKLSPHWTGPFQIMATHGPLNVTIKIKNKLRKVHVNRLKPS